MSEEPKTIQEWLASMSDQELANYKLQVEAIEDDETENLIYEEIGRRAAKKKL